MPYRSDEARARIQHVAAAGDLRGLPELLPHLPPHAHASGHDAAMAVDHLLRSATPLSLAGLDAWFRSASWTHPVAPEFQNIVIGGHAWDVVRYRGVVALCTMHWNGRVRESAVTTLAAIDDAFTLPLLLLRLNDWVDEIHDRAYGALAARVETPLAEAWIAALPLLDRLTGAGRRSAAIANLAQRVDVMLGSPLARDVLLRAAASALDPMVRRAAFMRARLLSGPDAHALLVRSATDGDTLIAVAACKTLFGSAQKPGPAHVRLALEIFKKQRQGALRARALEHAFRAGPHEAASTVADAIHDDARSVREVARHALTRREGVAAPDFAALYRTRLATQGTHPGIGTFEGLAEVATEKDLELLRSMLADPRARIRSAAWIGIGRADPAPKIEDAERALSDPSREVRAAVRPFARRLMGKGPWLWKRPAR